MINPLGPQIVETDLKTDTTLGLSGLRLDTSRAAP